jgi:hypothetical protein
VVNILTNKSHPAFHDRPPIPKTEWDATLDELDALIEAGLGGLPSVPYAQRLLVYSRHVVKRGLELMQQYDMNKWREAEAKRK